VRREGRSKAGPVFVVKQKLNGRYQHVGQAQSREEAEAMQRQWRIDHGLPAEPRSDGGTPLPPGERARQRLVRAKATAAYYRQQLARLEEEIEVLQRGIG